MIVFITIRVSAAICLRASPSQPQTGTHGNPALASCVWSTWWVTLGEQTRVISRECRRSRKITYHLSAKGTPYIVNAGVYDDKATVKELSKLSSTK